MQQSPLTLRQRLIDAVDESYHVKDMGEIIEVLGTLEVLPVTKELLETTRLGKTVNEFRKRTNDEKLAKGAKALVKKWRDAVLVSEPSPSPASPAPSLLSQSTSGQPLNGNSDGGEPCHVKVAFPSFTESEVNAADLGANIANDQPQIVSENVGQLPKRGRKKKQTNVIDAETLLHQQIAQAQQESKIRTVHRLSMEVFDEEHSRPSDSGTEHSRKTYSPVFTREPVIKSEIVENYLLSQNELRTKMERQYQDAVDRNEIPLIPDEPSPPPEPEGEELDTKKRKKRKKYSVWPAFPSESEILSRLPPIDPKIFEELKNFQFDTPSESEEVKSKAEIETEIPTTLTTTTNETTNLESIPTEGRIPSKIDWGDSDDEDDLTNSVSPDSIADIELTKSSTPPIPSAYQALSSPVPMEISFTQDEAMDEEPCAKEIEDSDVDRLHVEKVENLNGNSNKDGQFREWHEVLEVESFKGDLLHILPYTVIDF